MRAVLVAVLALSLTGCASPVGTLTPTSVAAGDVRFIQGVPSVRSLGPSSRVFLAPTGATTDPDKRIVFQVFIENRGPAPINVGPENFTAETLAGKPLRIYTAEKLENEARQQALDVKVGAALSAASNSMVAANAGRTYTTGTFSGNSFGTVGGIAVSRSTNGGFTSTTYDTGAAASARFQAASLNREIYSDAQAARQSIMANSQVGAFQRQTLAPWAPYTSLVTFDRLPDRKSGIVVRLLIGEDLHVFTWNYSQEK